MALHSVQLSHCYSVLPYRTVLFLILSDSHFVAFVNRLSVHCGEQTAWQTSRGLFLLKHLSKCDINTSSVRVLWHLTTHSREEKRAEQELSVCGGLCLGMHHGAKLHHLSSLTPILLYTPFPGTRQMLMCSS